MTMMTKDLVAEWRQANTSADRKVANRVSSVSAWTEPEFSLDTGVSGRRIAGCGLGACPPIYLETAKSLIWSGLVDPRGMKKLQPSTVANQATNFTPILSWLAENNIERLCDVDDEVLEDWLDDLEDDIANGKFVARDGVETTADARPSLAAVGDRIKAWGYLIDQSESLRSSEQDALPASFRLSVVPHKEAKRLTKRLRWAKTPSLPDEIAEEALDAAERILNDDAPDVIRALESLYNPDGVLLPDPEARLRSLNLDFIERPIRSASKNPADAENLVGVDEFEAVVFKGSSAGRRPSDFWRQRALMRAIRRVRSAGAIHLLGVSAQRPSELLSTDVAYSADDKLAERTDGAVSDGRISALHLPACISVKTSYSGLYELFYLKGFVCKSREQRVTGEWLIGSRPIGETEVPSAVKTIMTLERLLAPFRSMGDDTETRACLFVGSRTHLIPSGHGSVVRLSRLRLRKHLLTFYDEEIDWDAMPDFGRSGRDLRRYKAVRGQKIRMTQWRKLYVEYMMRADARLRPALFRQLHHVSTAMIGGDYLSSDPSIIEGARDASSAELARLLVGIVRGKKVAGRMAEVISGQLEEVRRLTKDLNGEAAIAEVQDWMRERQLGLYALGPSKCLVALMPQQALCHIVAGTATFRQTTPSYATRTDERCARCPCALVDDEHLHFWVNRYVVSRRAILRELAASPPEHHDHLLREFRVIVDRANYAADMLAKFDYAKPCDFDLLELPVKTKEHVDVR